MKDVLIICADFKTVSIFCCFSLKICLCWCLVHQWSTFAPGIWSTMGVYLTDEYTPLPTTTFLLPLQALFDRLQIKSELNSRLCMEFCVEFTWSWGFSGLCPWTCEFCAEMNSCDFYWNICLLMRKWSSQTTSLFSTCDWLCHLNWVFVSLEFVHL